MAAAGAGDGEGAVVGHAFCHTKEFAVLFAPSHKAVCVDKELTVVGSEIGLDGFHVGQVGGHHLGGDALYLDRVSQTNHREGRADNALVLVADTGGHLALFHGNAAHLGFGMTHVDFVKAPQRSTAFGSSPTHYDCTGVLSMQFNG